MPIRRGRLETYRDMLLAVGFTHGKPTRLMGWTGLSYMPMKRILEEMVARKLLNLVKGEDSRSRYRFEITEKGAYVVRYLTEVLEFIDSTNELDPKDVPPVWFMRKAIAERGFDLTPPAIVKALPDFSFREEKRFSESRNPRDRQGYYCPGCDKRLFSKHGLMIHIARMHKERKKELIVLAHQLYP